MRVSLQFTVDFDELPDRIVGFVRDACSRHDQIDALELLTSVEGCIKDDNTMAAINSISEFRSRLARIDFQLEDCVNIIRDYHMALVGEVKPVHQEPEPEPVKEPEQIIDLKPTGQKILISPLANKLAIEKGIDINQVKGTGDNGRIVKRDIENYKPASFVNTNKMILPTEESSYDLPNSTMRKSIAKRLSESKFTAPHYYLTVEFEMDNIISFRQQYINTQNKKISYNDIIVKAVALSLVKNPKVNSRWYDDKIEVIDHIHLGVAVAVEDGLVVPVVKFATSKDFAQINDEIRDFAERAKNKKLTPAEIEGSTFTISNLGMFGIESFTSIINQPNSAILSVGSIIQKPIVKDGEVVVGNTMKLTLACDHRTVDGATGSLFLKTLKDYIENPVSILI